MNIKVIVDIDTDDMINYIISHIIDYINPTKSDFIKCIKDYLNEDGFDCITDVDNSDIEVLANTCKEYCNKLFSFNDSTV